MAGLRLDTRLFSAPFTSVQWAAALLDDDDLIAWALIFLLSYFRVPLVPKETKGRLYTAAATPGSPPASSQLATSIECSFF